MGTSLGTQIEADSIQVRELPLTGKVGPLQFTKALIEVNPPGLMAVVHYLIDGNARENGIAIDLDKGIFLDACEEVDVSKMAPEIRSQIVAQVHEAQLHG